MIRRLARRFDFDFDYYFSGAALLVADQAVMLVTGLATTWCFSRFAPKSVYGAYGYVLAIANWLTLIALPGVSQAIQRSAARGFHGAYAKGVRQRLTAGAVAGAIMLAISVLLFALGRTTEASGALVASVLFPLALTMDDYRSVLFGLQRFGVYLTMHTVISFGVAAATITALVAGLPFALILAANMGSRGVMHLLSYAYIQKILMTNDRVDEDFGRFGWNLSLVGIVGGTAYQLDRIIIGSALGLEVMAAYELAMRLTDPLRNIGVFLYKLLFPRAVRVSGAAVARRFYARLLPLCGVLAAVGVAAMVLFPPVIRWLFPKYPESLPLVQWLIWSSLLSVAAIYLETFYLSQERFHRTYYGVNVARPVAIIILTPPLIYFWGPFGAVWSTLLVRAATAAYLSAKLAFDRRMLIREEQAAAAAEPAPAAASARCPLCGEPNFAPEWTVPARPPATGGFRLVRCASCALVRQEPRVAESEASAPWSMTDEAGGEKVQRHRRTWLRWAADNRPGPQEIGWPRYLAARWSAWRAGGAHPLAFAGEGKKMLLVGVEAARWSALGWRVDAVADAEYPPPTAAGYDAIVAAGLETSDDPLASLRAWRERLAPDGVLVVHAAWPDSLLGHLAGAQWAGFDQPRRRVFFTRELLAAALRSTGWRCVAAADHSSAASWLDSFPALRGRWGARLAKWSARLADGLHLGDAGWIIAVRDDKSVAGWSPREMRERLVR